MRFNQNNWTMSDERAHMENLLNQRFHFFLIFFSIIIAVATGTNSYFLSITVLIVGTIISWLFYLTIKRAQDKLDIILKQFLYKEKDHPAKIINDECDGKSRRKWIGKISFICCWILTISPILLIIYIFYLCNYFVLLSKIFCFYKLLIQ